LVCKIVIFFISLDWKLLNDIPNPTKAELAAVFSIKSLLFIFLFLGAIPAVHYIFLVASGKPPSTKKDAVSIGAKSVFGVLLILLKF
jgi:hypothetical protein